jgi:hypothetical protein
MRYFLQRMFVFLAASLFVFVVLENLASSSFRLSAWINPLLPLLLGFLLVYIIFIGLSQLLWPLVAKMLSIESRSARDTLFAMCYVAGSAVFLFGPRPKGFSFGDNIGEIIADGYLTTYGWQVQSQTFAQCALVAVLFWTVCRISSAKCSKGDN